MRGSFGQSSEMRTSPMPTSQGRTCKTQCSLAHVCMELSSKMPHLLCADFRGAKEIEPEQLKQGTDWQLAIYDDDVHRRLGLQHRVTDLPNPMTPGKNWYCP